jgi:hypothetical protein
VPGLEGAGVEKLTVAELGPIKDFTMETNRLTVLIGPQASGKSLLAQLLYFFNGLEMLLSERYDQSWGSSGRIWKEDVLRKILYGFRNSDYLNFCIPGTFIGYYSDDLTEKDFSLFFDERGPEINKKMSLKIDEWVGEWSNKYKLIQSQGDNQVYIPTERSMYTRVSGGDFSVFSAGQTTLFIKFAQQVEECKHSLSYQYDLNEKIRNLPDSRSVLARLQHAALRGVVDVQGVIDKKWVWKFDVNSRDSIPMASVSSGQMETWPFFALATVFGLDQNHRLFYFEEPETHLHPNAQVEVVRTIAYLISRGHRFVITTHSPFILYVINNLIQAHIAYDGAPPEGEFSINPDHVAAYCLGDNPQSIVDKETKLLKLDEIDNVLDSIGKQFYDLLNRDVKKNA